MYRILLVDDEILVREMIRERIDWEQFGFELTADCEDGREALKYLETTEIDVVLTDIYMPHLDGLQLSGTIYERWPQTAVLIFSGYNDFEYAREAIKYGVSEYLLKPVTARELMEALVRIREKLDGERCREAQVQELARGYHKYTKHESFIISRILSRLTLGTQNVDESLAALAELNIHPEGQAFQVAVLEMELFSERKESALMVFAVENIAAELLAGRADGLTFYDTDNRVNLLFYYPQRYRQDKHLAAEICREIRQMVRKLLGINLSVGIGGEVKTLGDLPQSYQAALAVLELRYVRGKDAILDCGALPAAGSILGMDKYIDTIRLAMLKNDRGLFQETLQSIKIETETGCYPRSELVIFLYQVLRTIRQGVNEVNQEFGLSERELTAVNEAADFGTALEAVAGYADRGFAAIASIAVSGKERLVRQALDFLKRNYARPDLSLSDVSSYLNLSSSHFTYVIKEVLGRTFIEVLTDIRMEKAKQLLVRTELKNYEIAGMVGFMDPHYFGIAFKKATGFSPKAYAREKQA